MSLFKKKKKATDVMITSNVNPERKGKLTCSTDELKVEKRDRNYVIFSDASSMYLCMNNDFANPITFEDCTESIQGTVILKKDDIFALLYFNNASEKFEVTDFIFTSIKEEEHSLLLTTSDNKKHFYCYYALYNDILDYTAYNLDLDSFDRFNLVIIKFNDHVELYRRYFNLKLELLFSAKNIELCTTFNGTLSCEWKAIFKYVTDENNSVNYFIIDTGSLSIIQNENLYVSLNIAKYNEDEAAIIGTTDYGYKCIFDIYSPDETSKYYDDIQNAGMLFLCKDDNHVEIIDTCFNIYYENDFKDIANISLSYDKESDVYILSDNDSEILSLHLYNIYCEHFYSIFKADEEYGTLYNFEPYFCVPNFVKICEHDIFEFKDEYLATISNYYAFFKKDAIPANEIELSLKSKHLKNIYFSKNDEKVFNLGTSNISVLQKCDVTSIQDVYKSDDDTIVIEAFTSICSVTISCDKVKVEVITGEEFELNVSDIDTNLTDYIFEHVTNKFSIAYLKHRLTW